MPLGAVAWIAGLETGFSERLKALENDRYARITIDKLPDAEIAVIDETFKANSATPRG